jgi:hypothetical protein
MPKPRSGGKPPKGSAFTENFSQEKEGNLSEEELKRIAKRARYNAWARENRRKKKELLSTIVPRETKQENDKDEVQEPYQNDLDDGKSPLQMLNDMRNAYAKANGSKKLEKLIKKDDKQFVAMVKELMKIETAILTTKIRAKSEEGGKGGGQTVFVILKGLEDEKKIMEIVQDKSVDMKQITQAINPDGTDFDF